MKAKDFGLNVARSFSTYEQCFCPFHHDIHPSAVFYNDNNSFYCFVCQKRFDLRQIISVTKSTSFSDAEIDEFIASIEKEVKMVSFFENDDMINARKSLKPLDSNAIEYLEKRGIDIEVAKDYGVVCTDDGVVFVHICEGGAIPICGFVVRLYAPSSKSIRYIKNGQLDVFWPLNRLKIQGVRNVFVTEGPFKAMKLKMALDSLGMKDSVSLCSFGLKFDRNFVKSIQDETRQFFIIGDNDFAGIKWAKRFKEFDGFSPFTTSVPFDDADVDFAKSMIEKILLKANKNSMRLFDENI